MPFSNENHENPELPMDEGRHKLKKKMPTRVVIVEDVNDRARRRGSKSGSLTSVRTIEVVDGKKRPV